MDVKQLSLLLESLHAVEGVLLGYLSHFLPSIVRFSVFYDFDALLYSSLVIGVALLRVSFGIWDDFVHPSSAII